MCGVGPIDGDWDPWMWGGTHGGGLGPVDVWGRELLGPIDVWGGTHRWGLGPMDVWGREP